MKKLLYPACFYPCEDKPGAYTVVVLYLPGCISEGDSLEDVIAMATDAASGWVLDEMEEGRAVPAASDWRTIHPDSPDGFVNILVLDMNAYVERYGNKAVRKKTDNSCMAEYICGDQSCELFSGSAGCTDRYVSETDGKVIRARRVC